MKKIWFIGFLLIGLIFIFGCESIDVSKVSDDDLERISEKAIVCNEPYIKFGTSCCLDQNDNKICDEDEGSINKIVVVKPENIAPERILPERCILAPGLACISHKIEPTQATLIISNGLGRTITVTNIDIAGCSGTFNTDMQSGSETRFDITGCDNGASGDGFEGDIILKYTAQSGLTKTVYGDIATRIWNK